MMMSRERTLTPASMPILGIDPGYGRCGFAVLTKEAGRERVIHSTCVETEGSLPFPERLLTVVRMCESLITTHMPHSVALERLYFTSNQKTAMQVAEVRGALIYSAASHGLSIYEYTPAQVKVATAGWGRSDKQGVERMVGILTGLATNAMRDDEVDAIAVGLTHLAHARAR